MKHYVVVDLEMCRVSRSQRKHTYKRGSEIIQIGAVLLDGEYNEIDQFMSYVHPEYGDITPFIRKLTNISHKAICRAESTSSALQHFFEWIPDGSTIVSWSMNDYNQLKYEIETKNIDVNKFYEFVDTWTDCQEIFGKALSTTRPYRLGEALIAGDIDCHGNAHDGLADAINTGRLFAKLMRLGSDFQVIPEYRTLNSDNEFFGFSLSNLINQAFSL